MLGIDPVTAGTMLILAASSKNFCKMPQPAEINVIPSTEEVEFDYSQSMMELQNYGVDTVNPHEFGGISVTQGFMQGAIRMEPEVKLNYKHYPRYDAVCIWYESINIRIEIDPKIVIASEVADDRCMGEAVEEHEMKHVKVDRRIVNKYARIMGEKVFKGLQERGFISEPVRSQYAKQLADRMQKTVFQIVEHEYKKMDLERAELQQAVDTKDEYDRVQALCPEFDKKRNAMLKKKR